MPLQQPQIPNRMTRDWTRVSAVRVRRITAWTIAEALQVHVVLVKIVLFLSDLAKIWGKKDLGTAIPKTEFYENSWGGSRIISFEQKSFWVSEAVTFWTLARTQHFFVQIQSEKLACEETEGTCRGRLINFCDLKVINFNICGKETNKISQRHLRKEICGYFTDKLKIPVSSANRKGVWKSTNEHIKAY